MINKDKWIGTLPNIKHRFNVQNNQLDYNKWTGTIPKKSTYSSIKKYSLTAVLFVIGLLFVSTVKNETRNLQKEISNLQTSIGVLKFNLDQALLDNEVITSPENISRLAKEYLSTDLVPYKKSQIRYLDDKSKIYTELVATREEKINRKKNKNLSTNVKSQVAKRIKETKTEIRKLQELYYNPKSIPKEIRTQVAKQIKEKKIELKNIYYSPKDTFTIERIQSWGAVQLVKAFLGIPIVPGR